MMNNSIDVTARLRTIRGSDVIPEQIEWLWPEIIARGKISLISGQPGIGKSFLTIALATHVSRGAPWPVDRKPCPTGDVVMMSSEDGIADTMIWRLKAADGDARRVHFVECSELMDEEGNKVDRIVQLQRDMRLLDKKLTELPDAKLVVIDPVSAYMGATDTHVNAEVREFLNPLSSMAMKHKAAVVIVSHLNKNTKQAAIDRSIGSIGFMAAARAGLLCVRDPQDKHRRLLLVVKNNLGPDNFGFAYSLEQAENEHFYVAWEDQELDMTADEALTGELEKTKDDRAYERAEEWLKDKLLTGPKRSKDLQEEVAATQGMSWRTVMRVRKDMELSAVNARGKWYVMFASDEKKFREIMTNSKPDEEKSKEKTSKSKEEVTKSKPDEETTTPSDDEVP